MHYQTERTPPSLSIRDQPAEQPMSLKRNFSWTFIGNVIYAGCQWVMLMLMAKSGTPEMVGQYSLGLAITAPIITFANLQLRGLQVTDANRQYSFRHYLTLRLVTSALAILAGAGAALVLSDTPVTALVVILVTVAKSFEAVSDIVYGLFQQRERMDIVARSMVLKGALSLVGFGAGLYFGGILLGVLGLAVTWLLVLLGYDLRTAMAEFPEVTKHIRFVRPKWSRRQLLQLAWLALPMGFATMLSSLTANIPRYFIEHSHGVHDLGVYSAMAYVLVAGRTIESAMGQSASPRLAAHYASGDFKRFRRLLFNLLAIGGVMGIVGYVAALVAGDKILTILYKPEYGESSRVFIWLMAAATFQYLFALLGAGITAMRKFKVQFVVHCVNIVVLTVASAVWVKSHGLLGAAWATMASSLFSAMAYAAVALKGCYSDF